MSTTKTYTDHPDMYEEIVPGKHYRRICRPHEQETEQGKKMAKSCLLIHLETGYMCTRRRGHEGPHEACDMWLSDDHGTGRGLLVAPWEFVIPYVTSYYSQEIEEYDLLPDEDVREKLPSREEVNARYGIKHKEY